MSKSRLLIAFPGIWLLLLAVLLLLLLWQLRNLVLVLLIAIVVAATLGPIVDGLERLRIPRWLAVIVLYLLLIAGLTGAGLIIGPAVITQIQRLTLQLPSYLEELRSLVAGATARFGVAEPGLFDQLVDTQALTGWLIRSSQQLLIRSVGLTRGLVGSLVNLLLVLVVSGYMLAGSKVLIQGLVMLFPYPWNKRLEEQMTPMSQRMGGYIQGRIVVSGILGIAITLGLRFLGLSEFALALGVIAGFTNLIPFVGPVLGALPALVVAIAQGGWGFLWVLLLFVVLQNVETYVLDPLLVGSSVNVHPLYQLLGVIAGTQILGITGALIVPPWVAGGAVLLENLYLRPKLAEESLLDQPQPIASGHGDTATPISSSSASPDPPQPP